LAAKTAATIAMPNAATASRSPQPEPPARTTEPTTAAVPPAISSPESGASASTSGSDTACRVW